MSRKSHNNLKKHFEYLHSNPHGPLNPSYDPKAKEYFRLTVQSMEKDRYYDNHTLEECEKEWRRRYNLIKQGLPYD